MGWCSGTLIFDRVADFVLDTDKPDDEKYRVLKALVEALEDQDWDCQSDSIYYVHPIVQQIFKSLHPRWFEPYPCPECGGYGRRTGTGMMEDPNDPTGEPLPYPIEVLCGTCGGNGFM